MKVNTFTVIVGNKACNACCPFCVSRMTPECGVNLEKPSNEHEPNFEIAARFAVQVGATTALLTGKGEPTLWPNEIDKYCDQLWTYGYRLIELQTNGKIFFRNEEMLTRAKRWYDWGMRMISVSVVSHANVVNNAIMHRNEQLDFNFWEVVSALKKIGFSIRMNCTLMRGGIDSLHKVAQFIEQCRVACVEQITLRSVAQPEDSSDLTASHWVSKHTWKNCEQQIMGWLQMEGATLLLHLPHGAFVYDFKGQNVCINNCLTSTTDPEDIRQLIYFPDGHLRYDWKYPGAIIF